MSGPDSISDPVARRISYTGSFPSAHGSARLNSARLGSRLVTWQVGPNVLMCQLTGRWYGMLIMHADVSITSCWCHHGPCYCAWWCRNYIMLMSSLTCLLFMLTSLLRHSDVINIRVSHMGRVNWYSGRVNPSGWRRRVGRVGARGQTPCQRVMESAAMSDVRFWYRFHQWLRLFLLYTVVWSKHNFDNFHFWAKSNTPLNHVLWYQCCWGIPTPHARTGGVLIGAQRRGSTLGHNI